LQVPLVSFVPRFVPKDRNMDYGICREKG